MVADRFCGNCGQELRASGRFCPGCGQRANGPAQTIAPASAAQHTPPQRHSAQLQAWGVRRILFLIVVVPILLAVAWFVFQFATGFLNGLVGG